MRYSYGFILHKKTTDGPSHLNLRVRWDGGTVTLGTGYVVNPDKWDPEKKRCVPRSFHGSNLAPASAINAEIERFGRGVVKVFASYVHDGLMPSVDRVRTDLRSELGMDRAETPVVITAFDDFVSTQSKLNSWRPATYKKFKTARRKLTEFGQFRFFEDFTTARLTGYAEFLKEGGINNNTLKRQIGIVRWFLNWADGRGYVSCRDYASFRPKITTSHPPVIYLTWEELMRVWDYRPKHVDGGEVRDMFCFSCFTSLRFSDVQNLRWADVREDSIVVETVKTSDPLVIELNDYSREILARQNRCGEYVFPRRSNQVANRRLKFIMKNCGIDTPIRSTVYHGSERADVVKPKWEMVGTHAGRRTFICNALMMGISPMVVMQWTGHSDYQAMKPYIAIADECKADAMKRFNRNSGESHLVSPSAK